MKCCDEMDDCRESQRLFESEAEKETGRGEGSSSMDRSLTYSCAMQCPVSSRHLVVIPLIFYTTIRTLHPVKGT